MSDASPMDPGATDRRDAVRRWSIGWRGRLGGVALLAALWAGCNASTDRPASRPTPPIASRPAPEALPPAPAPTRPSPDDRDAPRARQTSTSDALAHEWDVDLRRDESRGGHTMARHVGRSDGDLQARLARESISAASTYPDLETAERVVALALAANARRVQRWMDQRGPRSNLAIRYRARNGLPTGRLMRRGEAASAEVDGAVVVLRWRDGSHYVLTSYPEGRR